MKTTVERVDDTRVKLSITVEAERVKQALDEAARHLAQEVRVPGFRPGRAPRRVLETRLGKEAIIEHAVNDSLPGFYAEAVQAEELSVVGQPRFEVETFEDGREGVFTVTVDVLPEFDVPDYEGLQIPHPEWEVTDEEVDEQLEQLRERFAELETVSRPVQVGDYVLVTVTGTQHGERIDEASADDLLYEVKDPEVSDQELDRQLIGSEPGAILKFNDTLGPDYGERAGQEVSFTVIVKEVKAKRLPDLDDDFAITASEYDTIEELREGLRQQLADGKLASARQALRGRVVEAVAELVDVPLPESLVQQETQWRLQQLSAQAQRYGMDFEQYVRASGTDPEKLLEQLTQDARKTVKAQLVVDAIGRKAGIDVSQEDLGQEVARQSLRLGRSPQELAELFSQPENIGALVSDAFRRKTIDHILEHVEVLSGPPEEVLEAAERRAVAAMQSDQDAAERASDDAEQASDDAEQAGDGGESAAEEDSAEGAADQGPAEEPAGDER